MQLKCFHHWKEVLHVLVLHQNQTQTGKVLVQRIGCKGQGQIHQVRNQVMFIL